MWYLGFVILLLLISVGWDLSKVLKRLNSEQMFQYKLMLPVSITVNGERNEFVAVKSGLAFANQLSRKDRVDAGLSYSYQGESILIDFVSHDSKGATVHLKTIRMLDAEATGFLADLKKKEWVMPEDVDRLATQQLRRYS